MALWTHIFSDKNGRYFHYFYAQLFTYSYFGCARNGFFVSPNTLSLLQWFPNTFDKNSNLIKKKSINFAMNFEIRYARGICMAHGKKTLVRVFISYPYANNVKMCWKLAFYINGKNQQPYIPSIILHNHACQPFFLQCN